MPRERPTAHVIRDVLVIIAVTLGALAPFVGKPFHIDDPTFLWTAKQITAHPLDFYRFDINWYGRTESMHDIMQNPPLAAYFMAAGAIIVGWSEIGQHVLFLIPALGAALGTYALARRLCSRPVLASLAGVLTPGFMVCASSVMCDVLMVCLWVWAIVCWDNGIRSQRWWWFTSAAVLVAACALTKYFGIALIPLLLAYSIMHQRRWRWWNLHLLLCLALLAAFEAWSHHLYGHSLIMKAFRYSVEFQAQNRTTGVASTSLVGLAFLGGCGASVLFFAARMWSVTTLAAGFLFCVMLSGMWIALGGWHTLSFVEAGQPRWGLLLQSGIWVTTGLGVILMAVNDVRLRKDPASVLLALWVLGTFVFSTYLNWSVTARTMLPAMPAIGILIARQLDARRAASAVGPPWIDACALIPSAILAMAVTWGDCSLASTQREAAHRTAGWRAPAGRTTWFQGHWGFQWYMEQQGARPLDLYDSQVKVDDVVVIPSLNSNVVGMPLEVLHPLEHVKLQPARWVTTAAPSLGAGFHSSAFGPLPFAFGSVPADEYFVVSIRNP